MLASSHRRTRPSSDWHHNCSSAERATHRAILTDRGSAPHADTSPTSATPRFKGLTHRTRRPIHAPLRHPTVVQQVVRRVCSLARPSMPNSSELESAQCEGWHNRGDRRRRHERPRPARAAEHGLQRRLQHRFGHQTDGTKSLVERGREGWRTSRSLGPRAGCSTDAHTVGVVRGLGMGR
jgi:hypothetical protein